MVTFNDGIAILTAAQEGTTRRTTVTRKTDSGRSLTMKCNGICGAGESALAASVRTDGALATASIPVGDNGATQKIPGPLTGDPARRFLDLLVNGSEESLSVPVAAVKPAKKQNGRNRIAAALAGSPSANGK